MNVFETIRTKRAVRQYQDKPIPDEAVQTILNAGRFSQSAKNSQPWHFVAIREKAGLKQLAEAGRFSAHLGQAALGVVILTPPPEERFQIMFDAGQAAAYMQLAAWELGIGSCPVTSFAKDQARQVLGVPAEFHVRIALAFGYPLHPPRSPRKGGRRALAGIVHWEKW